MSAYIVSDECINTLAAAITATRRADAPAVEGFPVDPRALGVALRRLNEKAVCARYSDGTLTGDIATVLDMAGCEYEYSELLPNELPAPADIDDMAGSFLYQCSEGDIPNTPLFCIVDAWRKMFKQALNDVGGQP